MTYLAELDDQRQQARYGYASNVITYWPKVDGQNRAVTSATAIGYQYNNTSLGALAVTNDTVSGVSRLRVTVNAASLEKQEDARVDFLFTYGGIVHSRSVRFDVVAQPFFGQDEVSLNDLEDDFPDTSEILSRQAAAQEDYRSAEDQASVIISRAWNDVRGWLRKRVESDYPENSFPSFIVNREDVRPVIVAQALSRMFLADDNGENAKAWGDIAANRFAAMPSLKFDHNQDGAPDTEISGYGTTTIGRSW